MNKKFAAVSLGLVLTLTTCHSANAIADETQDTQLNSRINMEKSNALDIMFEDDSLDILFTTVEEDLAQKELDESTEKVKRAVSKLKKQLWSSYGLGGSQPGWWDCSGLVRWFYGNLDVDLRHSATAQARAGKKVNTPKIGDIVAYHYGSKRYSFHTGIYIGDGKVLHAYNYVSDTLISDVKDIAKENNASFSYRRIMNTN
jgi:cell wall-associated NlpC family hydrolase